MTTSVGPWCKVRPCMHEKCDGRAAKWVGYQPNGKHFYSCSVHLARFVEGAIAQPDYCLQPGNRAWPIHINALAAPTKVLCAHPRCDGRAAHWHLPQGHNLAGEALHSCAVHLPRFCEIVLRSIKATPTDEQRRAA